MKNSLEGVQEQIQTGKKKKKKRISKLKVKSFEFIKSEEQKELKNVKRAKGTYGIPLNRPIYASL